MPEAAVNVGVVACARYARCNDSRHTARNLEGVMGTIEAGLEKTVARLEDQLKLWGAKLNVLVAKGKVAGQESKIDSQRYVDDLKAKLDAAQAKLHEAKAAGGEKWDTFKSAIESSWKDLESAFAKLVH